MRMQIVACIGAFSLSASIGARAEEPILHMKEFVSQVLTTHPVLTATEQEIEGARAELLSSQGAFDPVLKGEYLSYPTGDYSGTYSNLFVEQPLELYGSKAIAGYRRSGGNFPVYEDYYNTNEGGETRAGLEVPLLRDGPIDRRRASIAKASMQIQGANLTLQQRKIELAKAAGGTYWEWFSATRKYEIYRDLLKTAEDRDRQLAQRAQAGDLASIDRTDNQRQVLQRRSQLIAAERALRKSEYELSLFLWNSEGTAPVPLGKRRPTNRLSPPVALEHSQESAISRALASRIEPQRLDNQLSQQSVEADLAKNQILPRLDVQALASNDMGSGSQGRDEAELKTGIKIEIPLWTRTQRGRISAIEAKQRELTVQKSLAEQRITVEVSDALNALSLARERLKIAREEVRVAKELEQAERTKFEHGESNLIFVNLREQATADALVREIEALSDTWKGYVTYSAAMGEVADIT